LTVSVPNRIPLQARDRVDRFDQLRGRAALQEKAPRPSSHHLEARLLAFFARDCPHQAHNGDIAALVATGSGKVMGAFEIVGDPVEDRSHPRDPDKWPWTVLLRPLVLLDGRLAPHLRDFGLMAPHKYAGVKDPQVARRLLTAIHPSL